VKRIDDDVRRELKRFGPAGGMSELLAAWPDAVGPTISRNAWPARFARDGTLHVHTSDSVWAFELTSRAAEIAERVGVERLRFTAGPLPEPIAELPPDPSERRRRPSPASVAEAEALAAAISDENLRKVVARAAAASLEMASDDRSV
jgi:predicted nucleic acid-binding Zn ribbon protein